MSRALPIGFESYLEPVDSPLELAAWEGVELAPAAVVALLLDAGEDQRDPRIVLIQRAANLRHHAGQIALPGGKPEPEDDGLLATALREAAEEVGLRPNEAQILGRLEAVGTPTGYLIAPFVARVSVPWEPIACGGEASRVLTPRLSALERPGVHRHAGTRSFAGRSFPMHEFAISEPPLWGATARMVWDLLERLRRAWVGATG